MDNKRVTSQDVADVTGVSRTTVSFVLNNVKGMNISGETRRRVREAAERLSDIPDTSAQALASRRSKAVGLVMIYSPHHIATDAFLPQIIGGLMEVVQERNLHLLIESVDAELARAKHIDSMIAGRAFTAVFVASDNVAMGVKAAHRTHRPSILSQAIKFKRRSPL